MSIYSYVKNHEGCRLSKLPAEYQDTAENSIAAMRLRGILCVIHYGAPDYRIYTSQYLRITTTTAKRIDSKED